MSEANEPTDDIHLTDAQRAAIAESLLYEARRQLDAYYPAESKIVVRNMSDPIPGGQR